MALDALWAMLIPKVSGVSEVQVPIYEGLSDTPLDLPKVSRVSRNDSGGLGVAVINGFDTPDTPLENVRYLREPASGLSCTLDTPATRKKINTEAHSANDPLPDEILTTKSAGPPLTFSQRGPWLSDAEQTAARVYQAHHFNCQTCIAAGRGSRYDSRCALGLALWNTYSSG